MIASFYCLILLEIKLIISPNILTIFTVNIKIKFIIEFSWFNSYKNQFQLWFSNARKSENIIAFVTFHTFSHPSILCYTDYLKYHWNQKIIRQSSISSSNNKNSNHQFPIHLINKLHNKHIFKYYDKQFINEHYQLVYSFATIIWKNKRLWTERSWKLVSWRCWTLVSTKRLWDKFQLDDDLTSRKPTTMKFQFDKGPNGTIWRIHIPCMSRPFHRSAHANPHVRVGLIEPIPNWSENMWVHIILSENNWIFKFVLIVDQLHEFVCEWGLENFQI